jgi:hypothetical protein
VQVKVEPEALMTRKHSRARTALKARITWVRLTPFERAALERLAAMEERKLTEMIRELIRREADRRGITESITSQEYRDADE